MSLLPDFVVKGRNHSRDNVKTRNLCELQGELKTFVEAKKKKQNEQQAPSPTQARPTNLFSTGVSRTKSTDCEPGGPFRTLGG